MEGAAFIADPQVMRGRNFSSTWLDPCGFQLPMSGVWTREAPQLNVHDVSTLMLTSCSSDHRFCNSWNGRGTMLPSMLRSMMAVRTTWYCSRLAKPLVHVYDEGLRRMAGARRAPDRGKIVLKEQPFQTLVRVHPTCFKLQSPKSDCASQSSPVGHSFDESRQPQYHVSVCCCCYSHGRIKRLGHTSHPTSSGSVREPPCRGGERRVVLPAVPPSDRIVVSQRPDNRQRETRELHGERGEGGSSDGG